MRLYNFTPSGNCYKVRLLLSMLAIDYERIPTNSATGETLTPAFLEKNPRGQIPLLEDGEITIWDSMAILVYLARKYGGERWLPVDPLGEARVMQWLAVSENELLYGLARARAVKKFGRPFDAAQCEQEGRAGLSVMNQYLAQAAWLAADHATIADVACYPYVSLAHEAGIEIADYPSVVEWCARFAVLPGYLSLEQ